MRAVVFLMCFGIAAAAWGSDADPELEFHAPATPADPAAAGIMRDLADRLVPVYQDSDADRYLANLSALQLVAGSFKAADVSRKSLRDRRRAAERRRPVGLGAIYDVYARAKSMETEDKVGFAAAFAASFRDIVSRLSDRDAYALTRWLATSPAVFREAAQQAFDAQRGKERISESDALALVWKYLAFDAYRNFAPLVASLDAEDEHRRYTEEEVEIRTAKGTVLAALVVRPTASVNTLPTLFEFTIDSSRNAAQECAAHGYVGVVAYVRASPNVHRFAPFEHDGADARAVIDWIAKQPWSDGRVGMYGGRYSGFAAWSATKKLPPALKAIATAGADAPGIDFPMVGNIFQNAAFRWSLGVTVKNGPSEGVDDDALWHSLDQKWYASGARYRDLGRVFGKPNPVFIRWLNHPSYDRYWQKMLPYRQDFAHIDIPVLTVTGYYAKSEPAALYYFAEHLRYDPHAKDALLIGPYDDDALQRGPEAQLLAYRLDPMAIVDLRELRYQWFDHVFKDGDMPTLLQSRVNYEVTGANDWRHATSIAAMADRSERFYLGAEPSRRDQRLTPEKGRASMFVPQTLALATRTPVPSTAVPNIVAPQIANDGGVLFMTAPLKKAIDFSGVFSGAFDFRVNKMDVDLEINFYERSADGAYIRLFSPGFQMRASYANDRVHRHLLKAGERQTLKFTSDRLTSRRLSAGSRLTMTVDFIKRPDREINYGTGDDVSQSSVADGKTPVRVRWYGDSYVDIPLH